MATREFVDLYRTIFERDPLHYLTPSWSNGALKFAFLVSMATHWEISTFCEFSSLSNRAIDEVSRPNGRSGVAFPQPAFIKEISNELEKSANFQKPCQGKIA